MPYIVKEWRVPYDAFVDELLSRANRRNWAVLIGAVIREIGVQVYGDVQDTRYYKQNELIGVLSCMRLEWQQRLHLDNAIVDDKLRFRLLADMNGSSHSSLIEEIAAQLQQQPNELRAGHLNYFLTTLMVGVATRSWCKVESVADYIYSLEAWIYRVSMRPYEDRAMAKSGDVFPREWF